MLVYRVFSHVSGARSGSPGHADYLYRPQGAGRCDNPHLYDAWYYASAPEGAIGEVFGDLEEWSNGMFDTPYLKGGRRDLGVFELPDTLRLLDLDDAGVLAERGLRPTQVVVRNSSVTQAWARSVHEESGVGGRRLWDGVKWWSFWRATWPVFVVWTSPGAAPMHTLVRTEQLDIDHPYIESTRKTLPRGRR